MKRRWTIKIEKINIDYKSYLKSWFTFCKFFCSFEFAALIYMCPSHVDGKIFSDVAIFSLCVLPFSLPPFKQMSNSVHVTSREVWVSVGQREDIG